MLEANRKFGSVLLLRHALRLFETNLFACRRMKCPYCPVECAPKDAKRLFI
jgi:hypothetical protein